MGCILLGGAVICLCFYLPYWSMVSVHFILLPPCAEHSTLYSMGIYNLLFGYVFFVPSWEKGAPTLVSCLEECHKVIYMFED